MEDNITYLIITGIATALISMIGAIISIYNARAQRRKLEAEGDSSLAEAAESVASGAKVSNDILLRRIEEMNVREIEREQELAKLKREVSELKVSLDDWQNWAERLVYQVKSLGGTPVPFHVEESPAPLHPKPKPGAKPLRS